MERNVLVDPIGSMGRLYIYLHAWLFFLRVNVGKYKFCWTVGPSSWQFFLELSSSGISLEDKIFLTRKPSLTIQVIYS